MRGLIYTQVPGLYFMPYVFVLYACTIRKTGRVEEGIECPPHHRQELGWGLHRSSAQGYRSNAVQALEGTHFQSPAIPFTGLLTPGGGGGGVRQSGGPHDPHPEPRPRAFPPWAAVHCAGRLRHVAAAAAIPYRPVLCPWPGFGA